MEAPRTGSWDLPYTQQSLREVLAEDKADRFSEKGMQRKLALEHQGKMFGPSSEAGGKPNLSGKKGGWGHEDRQRQELITEGSLSHLPQGGVPSQGPHAQ